MKWLLIIPIINFAGSICSVIGYFQGRTPSTKRIFLVNFVLLLVIAILGISYYSHIDARHRAAEFYDRYKNISFRDDLSESKIRIVVADGLVIMSDLDFQKNYQIYTKI